MDEVQSGETHPPIHGAAIHAGTDQLSPGDHTVLALRQCGDQPIDVTRSTFASHSEANCTFAKHEGSLADEVIRLVCSA
jgi:hypothetical protein